MDGDDKASYRALMAVTGAQAHFMLEMARALVGLGVPASLLAERAEQIAEASGERTGLPNSGLSLNYIAERLRAEFNVKPPLRLVAPPSQDN
jgi:hypothetical protein